MIIIRVEASESCFDRDCIRSAGTGIPLPSPPCQKFQGDAAPVIFALNYFYKRARFKLKNYKTNK